MSAVLERQDYICLQSLTPHLSNVLNEQLAPACVVQRVNRFVVEVRVKGTTTTAHLPNSGRLEQLIFPGNEVLLLPKSAAHRKTDYDAVLAAVPRTDCEKQWSLIDSNIPSLVIAEGMQKGIFPEFAGLTEINREVTVGGSRLDYRLSSSDESETCWIELKSVTLVDGIEARFPDAPTERGTRHLLQLCKLAQEGWRCVVIFAVCRPDADRFAPNWEVDEEFSHALWEASMNGVDIYSYQLLSDPEEGTRISGRLPVKLSSTARYC